MVKRALFSVKPHKGLEDLAEALIQSGWKIIATSEAVAYLREKGIEASDVADFTGVYEDYGFPPTLHPKMEAALTTNYKESIDLVYDIPYGLNVGNDVGGRTLLALAAKGNKVPVMKQEDMQKVVDSIKTFGEIKPELLDYLQQKTNSEIAKHYLQLSSEHNNFLGIMGEQHSELLNGENIYQVPAKLFKTNTNDPLSINNFKQVCGEKPCFTNIADLDSILETLCKLDGVLKLNSIRDTYIVIVSKHGNPCGIGVSPNNPDEAINSALWGNPKAIWGGELIANFLLDDDLANIVLYSGKREAKFGSKSWMLDLIAAPEITDNAIKILGKSQKRKVFTNKSLYLPFPREEKNILRPVRGGFLSQPPTTYLLDLKELNWVSKQNINSIDALIAWATAFTSFHGGNEVAIAKGGALLGVGGGPSTYDATNTLVKRLKEYKHNAKGSVFGADAFFPFIDVPKILYKAGCIGGTVPSGGKREKEVIDYFVKKRMAVGMIPEKYRGFCRH